MKKTVVIHQPNFLLRTKVLIKIMLSDVWIIYDNVQYVRREWQNRVYLRDASQKDVLFTAAIQKADFHEQIRRIMLTDTAKQNQRLENFIRYNYSNAQYYNWLEQYVLNVKKETKYTMDLSTYNVICTNIALRMLGVNIDEKLASEYEMKESGRNEKLIELCYFSGCGNYICGSGGRTYIDDKFFDICGINVIYYDYAMIMNDKISDISEYKNRSFLDFIAYNGPEKLIDIVQDTKEMQILKYIRCI
ncbi:WbqC family protein [Traorella massiliensis]|uniref:WbqC family protein n=1 Tax=Traorella massiliensis TaxID=1903263 RepID=UPI002356534D|nr:WbqC family protein [Traorella massiliensis]